MRRILFLALIILVCGFNLFAQASITKEEYAVYAAILRDIRFADAEQSKNEFSFVILYETFQPEFFSHSPTGKFKSLSADFLRKNRRRSKLKKLFPINYEYETILQSEIDELLKIGAKEFERIEAEEKSRNNRIITEGSGYVWKFFHAKYPNTKGYYQFSRIGFSQNKKFAVAAVEGKGAYWFSTTEYILKKTKGKWIIYSSSGSSGVE